MGHLGAAHGGPLEHLVRWNLHPERTVTARFSLDQAGDAYALADSSSAGKVAIVMSD
jgi:threonine dehydrogenase-like Zn-dependent dehydrogenase